MDINEILNKNPEERTPEELEVIQSTDLTPEQEQQLEEEKEAQNPPENPEDNHGDEDNDKNQNNDNKDPEESEEEKAEREEKEENEKRKKHSENENRLIREQNSVFSERLSQIGEIPEPTDDDLREYEPEFEDLTPQEQRIVKRQWKSDKRAEQVHKITLETKSDSEWNNKLDKFIDEAEMKDEHPEITNNRSEFIKFATKKTHKGVPISLLVDAFKARQAFNNPNPNKGKKNTNLFERGGHRGTPPKNKEALLTVEQVQSLRKNDPAKYRQLVRSGKITKDLSSQIDN